MPRRGGRYRVKRTKTGKLIRLHFTRGGKVDEAKRIRKSQRRKRRR